MTAVQDHMLSECLIQLTESGTKSIRLFTKIRYKMVRTLGAANYISYEICGIA